MLFWDCWVFFRWVSGWMEYGGGCLVVGFFVVVGFFG